MRTTDTKRNTEFRKVPGVNPALTVSRDGETKIKGHGEPYDLGIITALDGTKMTIQMAIHKAFPDIPMRYTPKW
jgi:hypothetical protein